ncbi:acyltransferase family protein [Plantibacter sp. ME-Dv--P-095]|uniref:acyltransferase family protein n=1 Tax=Plantibacter sp. ME-Dv--P-095 TaxID=3040299 RepID=UPI002549EB01|nr:acyltransferase family protein [Plantibacter sp. ME-Dv--P-095]
MTTTSDTGTTPTRPTAAFRADIQGMRALAVTAVVLAHATGWPAGGFIGVDVFFVISGFLITGLLLREHERSGRISLPAFFGRRIKRILPAALVVLAATAALASWLFNTPRAMSTWWDAVSAALLVSNWRFEASGTDYFHATDAASPLQHFWSLSIEEQFYLVWPLLLLILLAIAAKGARPVLRSRIVVGIVLVVIVAASFAFAVWQSAAAPQAAYFATGARVWELAAGALLAVCAPLLARMPMAVRVIAGWAGLAGVVASALPITGSIGFPGPWALAPVASALLLIAAGTGAGPSYSRWMFPLGNPVSTGLGAISYSVYLWHLPILVFVPMLVPGTALSTVPGMLALICCISVLSFLLVEQPLHRMPLVGTFRGDTEGRAAAWTAWRDRFGQQFLYSAVGLVIVAGLAVIVLGPALRMPVAAGGPAAVAAPVGDPLQSIAGELQLATEATSWPDDLSPSLDDAISATSSTNPARACFDIGATPDAGSCTWGDAGAPKHVYLVGDSTALAYAPAFRAIADQSGGALRITTMGLYGCRFTQDLVQNSGAGVMDDCPTRKHDIAERIAADQPDLVIVSNAFTDGRSTDGRALDAAAMVASTLAETAAYQVPGRVVLLAPPPLGAELGSCYSRVSSPQDCAVGVDAAWTDFATASESAAAAAGERFISSLPFSCVDGVCPAFAGTTPTKYDRVHLTPAFAEHIAPAVLQTLQAAGAL